MEEQIIQWIKNYCNKNKIPTLVVGISGGIDSSLVSTLCALTGIKTLVVSLPIRQKKNQLDLARLHSNWLLSKYKNVFFIEKDLTEVFESFESILNVDEKSDLSLANSRSRLRMLTLYQMSSVNSGIVVGTGNKIEDFGVGFFTKYGDGGVDISPIADLTKTEVRNLARKLGINNDIINAAPTDGLWDTDRTDEEQLGATYEELEWAMETSLNKKDMSKREKEVLNIYKKFNRQNKHKMVKIPIFKKK
jgi:NAD+ synthase